MLRHHRFKQEPVCVCVYACTCTCARTGTFDFPTRKDEPLIIICNQCKSITKGDKHYAKITSNLRDLTKKSFHSRRVSIADKSNRRKGDCSIVKGCRLNNPKIEHFAYFNFIFKHFIMILM